MSPDAPPPIILTPLDTITEEDCGTWTQVGVQSATVSTIRLEVPGKARKLYQRACGEMKKKRFDDAESDAQKVVDQYNQYPAAWVLLGQVFYNTQRFDHAKDACGQAAKIDPDYVASYICLAAIASQERDWDDAQDFSKRALRESPLRNPYGRYYRAEAAYEKGDFRDAEKNALGAVSDDSSHQMPEIELLLARIYYAMKKSDDAALSIRDYLKWKHQPADSAAVEAQLSALSLGPPAAK